ncbi:ATP-dependent DNA helicase RecG [Cyclonatronum proteinivorum]|uniref:ATP-dependent DNA helicase RecG n=1 Tax=Cyclonatronum proteinivorum TaxID=1457365 RepID=A0A345UHY3_9BACT|nr:ATP-dependent DNA helicase RecG [Cyclonatronum proteinivorum]AXJ00085.1 ATP-dependent DNA helicase RecG [Cyclonatronum proteinivorum]
MSFSLSISAPRLKALHSHGLHTDQDLLDFVPRRYLDRNAVSSIGLLRGAGEEVTVIGTVKDIRTDNKRLEVFISDSSGELKCVWFRGINYFKKLLKPGDEVSVYGKVQRFGRWLSIAHPDLEKIKDNTNPTKTVGTIPVYASNSFFKKVWLTSQVFQQWASELLRTTALPDILPESVRLRLKLKNRHQAYISVHNPENLKDAQNGKTYLKFEELFLFELAVHTLKLRAESQQTLLRFNGPGELTKLFFRDALPFNLTDGQVKALKDIRSDFESGRLMNRLIQGDVGSGKTVVAIGAILMMLDNGYQAAFMAPTEILAEQHYRTLCQYLSQLDVDIRLLTGKRTSRQKRDILDAAAQGNPMIVAGTHALIQQGVELPRLGLIVVDEQHRFGVEQRARFANNPISPHTLAMSATPIPRSLALSVFGKLDISVIKGLPAGRKPIKTGIRPDSKREDVYRFLDTVLKEGGQVYIVYPLVEESEALDLENAMDGFEVIRKRFPDYSVGLLHGRMKADEKEAVMSSFESGETSLLVSTTVIEVGINVPNASVMVIEHAERFGLSQLHQLRGRIGRGSKQSYCILITSPKQSKTGKERLRAMTETNDGFLISEADLRLRGPGDFLGTRQSGVPEFKFADLVEDEALLAEAAAQVSLLLEDDPKLEKPEHQPLRLYFEKYLNERRKFFEMM